MPNLRDLAPAIGLTAIAALVLTGCATSLTRTGEAVVVLRDYSPSECESIASIEVEADTYRNALVEARNLAGDAGANRIVVNYSTVDDEDGAQLSATALSCEVSPPSVQTDQSARAQADEAVEGLNRDYPEYYNNIIRQIFRCFRWRDGGSWETEVFFYINRDGVAEDIQFVTRSGNTAFDFEAMGAVGCAGNGRFGPLPKDLPYDRFPIKFSFRPSGAPIP